MSNSYEISVSAAPWVPLSAAYPYDANTSFSPELFQYAEGYSFMHHPLFTNIKDVKAGNNSLFQLTSTLSLSSFLSDEIEVDSTDLVIFTGIMADNGKYITNVDGTLYATATSVGEEEFFRIENNNDGTHSLYHGTKAFTVQRDPPWNIVLNDPIVNDTYNTQKFKIFLKGNSFTLQTLYEATWWDQTHTPPQYINRFVSYSPVTFTVRAIGMVADDDYMVDQKHVFTSTINIGFFIIGYDGLIRWVKYFNQIDEKFYNRTVDIEGVISNIKQNYLVDTPYKTKLSVDHYTDTLKAGTVNINLACLKNVLTPEYEYRRKQ